MTARDYLQRAKAGRLTSLANALHTDAHRPQVSRTVDLRGKGGRELGVTLYPGEIHLRRALEEWRGRESWYPATVAGTLEAAAAVIAGVAWTLED